MAKKPAKETALILALKENDKPNRALDARIGIAVGAFKRFEISMMEARKFYPAQADHLDPTKRIVCWTNLAAKTVQICQNDEIDPLPTDLPEYTGDFRQALLLFEGNLPARIPTNPRKLCAVAIERIRIANG